MYTRRFIGTIVVLFQLLLLFPANGAAQDEEIYIPDPNLKAAIMAQLNKWSDTSIYQSDLQNLTFLNLYGKDITNLEGLQYATNLQTLYLWDNDISSLKPLENSQELRSLYLSGNKITDISPLTNLVNLQLLTIDGNEITDITPISNLINLTELNLSYNNITDISPLSNLLKLDSLSLAGNHVYDLSKLSNLSNLQSLNLSDNEITDITPLAALTNLTSVNVDKNFIENKPNQYSYSIPEEYQKMDVVAKGMAYFQVNWYFDGQESLEYLTKKHPFTIESKNQNTAGSFESNSSIFKMNGLKSGPDEFILKFANPELSRTINVNVLEDKEVTIPDVNLKAAINLQLNKAKDSAVFHSEMTKLSTLAADSLGIKDLEGLQYATNLSSLSLSSNQITDISPLASLKRLYDVNLSQNQITDISPLRNIKNLFGPIYLNNNQISDISPLTNCQNINSLFLNNNKITDIKALSNLTNLSWLILDMNPISDISPLSNLTKLTLLQLGGTNVTDISPLSHLTSLWNLSLGSNGLTDISALSNLNKLEYLYLDENKISDLKPLGNLLNLTFLTLRSNEITDISPIDHLNLNYLSLDKNFINGKGSQYSYTIPTGEITIGKNPVVLPVTWLYNAMRLNQLDGHLKDSMNLVVKNKHVEAVLQDNGNILVKGISNGDEEIAIQFANSALNQVIKIKQVDVTSPNSPVVNTVGDNSAVVTGTAEAGSTITIKAGTSVIGTAVANESGTFSVPIVLQKAGTILSVSVTDEVGNVSEATNVTVKDVTAPNVPTVNTINNKSTSVTGKTEVNAGVTVKIATKTYTGKADAYGNYTVTIPVQNTGTGILITAADNAGNVSAAKITTVVRVAPNMPTVNPVTNKSATVSGNTEKYAVVTVKIGTKTYTGKADVYGIYKVTIPVQNTGTSIIITAADSARNVSTAKVITVVRVAPNMPTINTVTNTAASVSGKAEKSTIVTVKIGTKSYTSKADVNGNYKVAIPVQNTGASISITAKDTAGNVSVARVATVVRVAPNMPTVNAVTTKSTWVTGKTEKYAVVTVKIGTKSYTAKADANGNYKVAIRPQIAGTKIYVSAKDANGKVSAVRMVSVSR